MSCSFSQFKPEGIFCYQTDGLAYNWGWVGGEYLAPTNLLDNIPLLLVLLVAPLVAPLLLLLLPSPLPVLLLPATVSPGTRDWGRGADRCGTWAAALIVNWWQAGGFQYEPLINMLNFSVLHLV